MKRESILYRERERGSGEGERERGRERERERERERDATNKRNNQYKDYRLYIHSFIKIKYKTEICLHYNQLICWLFLNVGFCYILWCTSG